jgi:hypothetical protein
MEVWPFKPKSELIESVEWLTDVFRAKAGEQRTAIRVNPRRTFNLTHLLTDFEYASARALIRAQQGNGFFVPDWTASVNVGAVSGPVSVPAGFPEKAMLWQSNSVYEALDVALDSNGDDIVDPVGTYTNARLVPLYVGYCLEGLQNSRGGARINQVSVSFTLYDTIDIGATAYPQYRGHDVVETCPVIGGGTFSESISWPLSTFDNQTSVPEYIRNRTIPDMSFDMRWHEFTAANILTLKQWIYSRRGRQKAFWLSSRGKDLEPVGSVSGTTLTVYSRPGLPDLAGFDIDVDGDYRQVTAVAAGTPVGGRDTLDLTIAALTNPSIQRISFLRCSRFNSDRVEFLHRAGEGMAVQVPCIEIPVP